VFFVAVALAGLAADLLTKHLVFTSMLSSPAAAARVRSARALAAEAGVDLPPREILRRAEVRQRLMPGVRLTLSTNPGIVFGLRVSRWVVVPATVVTVALVALFFAVSPARAHFQHAAFALIAAGALGNLYDRLLARVILPGGGGTIRHQVRDFIDCSEIVEWPVFNVADCLLVAGVAVLILGALGGFLAETRRARRA
jgi:lipoprotein signal peptidase